MKKLLIFFVVVFFAGCAAQPDAGDILYTNEALGFSLTFPESWKDHYRIIDLEYGIAVNFYGESLAGQGAPIDSDSGLLMFYIADRSVAETEFLDSRQTVGTVNNIDYCYATGTDVTLAPIILTSDNTLAAYTNLFGDEIYGEAQLPLIHQDWEQAQKMLHDIPEILASFQAVAL